MSGEGFIIGTAGHIDHGKTSLIRALTGTDTDRLAEEKRRGISIDLGFAHLSLPNGKPVSFVDVPGHERFIKNMLAGAGGIQAVLLVVAADESVKPQTREHFEICRLLGIRHGLVALTKADLATPQQLEASRRDVVNLCKHSFLEHAPILPVSAVSGAGIPALLSALQRISDTVHPRNSNGVVRLPIDRSFALRGFGTVVTGTLWSGRLHTGDTVEILPSKRQARIRGLQVHGKAVEEAVAGQRTAVNLAGIEHTDLQRGHTIIRPSELTMSVMIDVSVDWIPEFRTAKKRDNVLLHLGTEEVPAALKILHAGEEREASLARLTLRQPIVALPGDRFVLRRPSPAHTIAGGSVIDPFPILRTNRVKSVQRLQRLATADISERVRVLVDEGKEGRCLADLVHATGIPTDELRPIAEANPDLLFLKNGEYIVSKAWLQNRRTRLFTWLTAFHAKNPSAAGAPLALARLGLSPELAAIVVDGFSPVRVQGETISLVNHRAQLNSEQIRILSKLEAAFRDGGFQPPLPNEVLQQLSADLKQCRTLLESLIKAKRLIRISENVIFHSEVIAHIRASLTAHRGKKFSIPEFKEWMNITRKYAIPLLEYLDREHVTRREGDMRVVL